VALKKDTPHANGLLQENGGLKTQENHFFLISNVITVD